MASRDGRVPNASLERTEISAPRVPVFSSITARPFERIRASLAEALVRPVRWRETLLELRTARRRALPRDGPGQGPDRPRAAHARRGHRSRGALELEPAACLRWRATLARPASARRACRRGAARRGGRSRGRRAAGAGGHQRTDRRPPRRRRGLDRRPHRRPRAPDRRARARGRGRPTRRRAGRRALRAAGADPTELDLVLVATMSHDMLTPGVRAPGRRPSSARRRAGAIDVNAACTGFVCGAGAGGRRRSRAGRARDALVIGADLMSRLTDPRRSRHRGPVRRRGGRGACFARASGGGRIGPVVLGADGARARR